MVFVIPFVCLVIYCSMVMADDFPRVTLVPRAQGCVKAHGRRSVPSRETTLAGTTGEGLSLLFHRVVEEQSSRRHQRRVVG